MKKKIVLLLAIAAAGVFALTACTSSDKGTVSNPSVNSSTADQAVTDQTNAGSSVDNNDEEDIPAENTQDEIFAPEQGEPGYDGEPDGEVIPDEDVVADETASVDAWSGSYEASAESVSVQLQEDGNIFFAFAQSGISGIAEVNGTQAIFHGDDYHVVVFNVNGDTLDISVSSEEDFDASASPLNGSYKKIG